MIEFGMYGRLKGVRDRFGVLHKAPGIEDLNKRYYIAEEIKFSGAGSRGIKYVSIVDRVTDEEMCRYYGTTTNYEMIVHSCIHLNTTHEIKEKEDNNYNNEIDGFTSTK